MPASFYLIFTLVFIFLQLMGKKSSGERNPLNVQFCITSRKIAGTKLNCEVGLQFWDPDNTKSSHVLNGLGLSLISQMWQLIVENG